MSKPLRFVTKAEAIKEEYKGLGGEIEQWVDKEKRILKPGDVAHIPAGVVHATFNASKADATILAILSPGASKGPFMVDVSGEAPWNRLRGPA